MFSPSNLDFNQGQWNYKPKEKVVEEGTNGDDCSIGIAGWGCLVKKEESPAPRQQRQQPRPEDQFDAAPPPAPRRQEEPAPPPTPRQQQPPKDEEWNPFGWLSSLLFGGGESSASASSSSQKIAPPEKLTPGSDLIPPNVREAYHRRIRQILYYELTNLKTNLAEVELICYVFLDRLLRTNGDEGKVLSNWNSLGPSKPDLASVPQKMDSTRETAIANIINLSPATDLGQEAVRNGVNHFAHLNSPPPYYNNRDDKGKPLIIKHNSYPTVRGRLLQYAVEPGLSGASQPRLSRK